MHYFHSKMWIFYDIIKSLECLNKIATGSTGNVQTVFPAFEDKKMLIFLASASKHLTHFWQARRKKAFFNN